MFKPTLTINRMLLRLRLFRSIMALLAVSAIGFTAHAVYQQPTAIEEFQEEMAVSSKSVSPENNSGAQSPVETSVTNVENTPEETVVEATTEETNIVPMLEQAVEAYKAIRTMQADGAEEDAIYEQAFDAYKKADAALAEEGHADAEYDQLKGILMDLDNMMGRATVHYSSVGDSDKMTRYARAFVDIQQLPQMETAHWSNDPELYPAIVYIAASGSFNAGDLDGAIKYFETYLRTGDQKHRENIACFYGQSLLNTKQQERGRDTVVALANEFQQNPQLLTIAMQLCLDTSRRDLVGPLVERALIFKPNDERLLNLQAQVFEDNQKYRDALDIYIRLDEMHPNSKNINESIACCYSNLGTTYYNQSIQAVTEKDASKSRRQSNAFFSSAADKYEELVDNDPNNEKYLNALAHAYAVLGNKSKVDALNVRLTALGASPIAMNDLPVIMGDQQGAAAGSGKKIPSYQEYAKAYVTEEITKWAQRGEFEKVDDFSQRVSSANIRAEQKRLSAITEEKYLKEYAGHLMISQMKLQTYDTENETYAIESDYGPITIKVPIKNKEAEIFKNTWDKVQIRNAKFFILDDQIAISTITFHSPSGKDYNYNASQALAYEPPVVNVDLDKLIAVNQQPKQTGNTGGKSGKATTITVKSDVDQDIPQNKQNNTQTIALVIANENYGKVSKVTSAAHDGDVFAQYCRETLGIPDNQVLLYQDATYGNTLSAISQLKNTVKAMGPETDVIVYYAGHGVPDEKTMEAYMLPVDADPMVMDTAYPLKKLYDELSSMGAANVMVFMDACFSGSNRGEGMLADARAVVLKAKPASPKGNMFVLSAADGNETALPWVEKNHGLFTYYLLKKLKESKGNASLQDLADYVKSEVSKTSSLELKKPQTPKATATGALSGQLNKKKLRK